MTNLSDAIIKEIFHLERSNLFWQKIGFLVDKQVFGFFGINLALPQVLAYDFHKEFEILHNQVINNSPDIENHLTQIWVMVLKINSLYHRLVVNSCPDNLFTVGELLWIGSNQQFINRAHSRHRKVKEEWINIICTKHAQMYDVLLSVNMNFNGNPKTKAWYDHNILNQNNGKWIKFNGMDISSNISILKKVLTPITIHNVNNQITDAETFIQWYESKLEKIRKNDTELKRRLVLVPIMKPRWQQHIIYEINEDVRGKIFSLTQNKGYHKNYIGKRTKATVSWEDMIQIPSKHSGPKNKLQTQRYDPAPSIDPFNPVLPKKESYALIHRPPKTKFEIEEDLVMNRNKIWTQHDNEFPETSTPILIGEQEQSLVNDPEFQSPIMGSEVKKNPQYNSTFLEKLEILGKDPETLSQRESQILEGLIQTRQKLENEKDELEKKIKMFKDQGQRKAQKEVNKSKDSDSKKPESSKDSGSSKALKDSKKVEPRKELGSSNESKLRKESNDISLFGSDTEDSKDQTKDKAPVPKSRKEFKPLKDIKSKKNDKDGAVNKIDPKSFPEEKKGAGYSFKKIQGHKDDEPEMKNEHDALSQIYHDHILTRDPKTNAIRVVHITQTGLKEIDHQTILNKKSQVKLLIDLLQNKNFDILKRHNPEMVRSMVYKNLHTFIIEAIIEQRKNSYFQSFLKNALDTVKTYERQFDLEEHPFEQALRSLVGDQNEIVMENSYDLRAMWEMIKLQAQACKSSPDIMKKYSFLSLTEFEFLKIIKDWNLNSTQTLRDILSQMVNYQDKDPRLGKYNEIDPGTKDDYMNKVQRLLFERSNDYGTVASHMKGLKFEKKARGPIQIEDHVFHYSTIRDDFAWNVFEPNQSFMVPYKGRKTLNCPIEERILDILRSVGIMSSNSDQSLIKFNSYLAKKASNLLSQININIYKDTILDELQNQDIYSVLKEKIYPILENKLSQTEMNMDQFREFVKNPKNSFKEFLRLKTGSNNLIDELNSKQIYELFSVLINKEVRAQGLRLEILIQDNNFPKIQKSSLLENRAFKDLVSKFFKRSFILDQRVPEERFGWYVTFLREFISFFEKKHIDFKNNIQTQSQEYMTRLAGIDQLELLRLKMLSLFNTWIDMSKEKITETEQTTKDFKESTSEYSSDFFD